MCNQMTIDEMQKLREALESRIGVVAEQVVNEFQQRTGLEIDGVSINLASTFEFGRRAPVAYVTGARINVRL